MVGYLWRVGGLAGVVDFAGVKAVRLQRGVCCFVEKRNALTTG
jgi:hypothetical protein